MRYDLLRSNVLRDSYGAEHAELSAITILLVAACATLVACPTLVALTHGWDYRLAVMFGAVLAAALACFAWLAFPAARVADRLVIALAGAVAAALFAVYASDWLDWKPLDLDDAVAGMMIGLLLLAVGPVRQALRPAAHGCRRQAVRRLLRERDRRVLGARACRTRQAHRRLAAGHPVPA
jgi:hypothetical protein